ncbi:MAG: hypothetical protein GY913_02230 [Proteobacteria bacterium]|nr:hypothetical protein [Pseudomonadota bacterium]MCP4915717.1 hypothetical protein [Pseudomonadota bacterium]
MLFLLLSCNLGRQPTEGTFLQYGEECVTSDECASGLVCAGDDICRFVGEPGTAGIGEECVSSTYCEAGLACSSDGVCAEEGSPGTGQRGDECAATEDCQLGYACVDAVCYGFDLPLWEGETCSSEDGDYRVLFEVPGDSTLSDFYRMPFPNDGRLLADGTLDLSDHPSPGALIPELGDVVGNVLDGLEEDFAGFGTNAAVFFRFSAQPSYSNIQLAYGDEQGTIGIIDITPGTDTYDAFHPPAFKASTAPTPYICSDWMAIRPASGFPLEPGHTYAFFVRSDLPSSDSEGSVQDPDFAAMLSATPPAENRLITAWDAYQPVRDWLDDTGRTGDGYAGIAVVTAQDPTLPPQMLRTAVDDLDAPTATGLHLCDDDPGPYDFGDDDDPDRGCSGVDAAFHEIQGRVTLAQFQEGTVPFKETGGTIAYEADAAVPVRFEDVTFSLTVPVGEMPEDGWPVVLYAHGTGGNYREGVNDGLAGQLADVELADGTHVGFAVLTTDAVLHGTRRGEANWDPNWLALDPNAYDAYILFYNPLNPQAARDNALQSAADSWQLVRLLEEWSLSAGESPTGEAISFADVHYLGHSQGATTGPLTVAYEPALESAVLSAAGGILIETLLHKTSPYDIPQMVAVGLADPSLDRHHPLLNLTQMGAEPADGVNHAAYVLDDTAFSPRMPLLQLQGVGDTYTPDEAQEPLARALRLDQVLVDTDAMDGLDTESLPLSGNVQGITGVIVRYAAAGDEDPHFVLFTRDDAARHATHFLATAHADGAPTVVE